MSVRVQTQSPASVLAVFTRPRLDSPRAAYEAAPSGWHVIEFDASPGYWLSVSPDQLAAIAGDDVAFRHWLLNCPRRGRWRFCATPFGDAAGAAPVYG